MDQINKKSPVCILNSQYARKGKYGWPGSKDECLQVLENAYLFNEINNLFSVYEFPSGIQTKTKDWSFHHLICSALAFKFHGKFLNFLDWGTIYCFLLNDAISDEILLFLEENTFNDAFSQDLRPALYGALYLLPVNFLLHISEKSIKNFLSFLRIDLKTFGFYILFIVKN